jgi:hypothetical protein
VPDRGTDPPRTSAGDRHGREVQGARTAGKYRFRLKVSNGQLVAGGEAYESKAAAKKGCESV